MGKLLKESKSGFEIYKFCGNAGLFFWLFCLGGLNEFQYIAIIYKKNAKLW